MKMEVIRRFEPEQFVSALESWEFADLTGKTPLFTSPFGDVFLQGVDGIWFLDTLEGKVSKNWESVDELQSVLNTPDGQDSFLMAGLALAADESGKRPTTSQIFDFSIAPYLGGAVALENVTVTDFVVSLNIAGQIHSQLRDLPPGTPVGGITIS
jgi:hypothetical protein